MVDFESALRRVLITKVCMLERARFVRVALTGLSSIAVCNGWKVIRKNATGKVEHGAQGTKGSNLRAAEG